MQKYRFKFYLNAVHSIEIDGVMGQEHPHTWEFGIEVFKSDDSFIMFTEVERGVERLLSSYQNMNLNKTPPFDGLNPTLEHVAIYFKKVIERYLLDLQWFLIKVEVSETPSRSFIIENAKEPEDGDILMDHIWLQEIDQEVEKFIADTMQKTVQAENSAVSAGEMGRWNPRRGKSKMIQTIFVLLFVFGVIGLVLLLTGKLL